VSVTTTDFTAFCLFLPEPCGRAADANLGAVDDAGLPIDAEVFDDFDEPAKADAGCDTAAPLGKQGPHLTDRARDGGAVDTEQQARTSCVAPWRRFTRVANSRSMTTSLCFAPAPTARRRGRDSSSAWCHSCHIGPISATVSAITPGVSPVIR
jgi:hypothetical protein